MAEEKKFNQIIIENHLIRQVVVNFLKKYFGSLEKGSIFASAFDEREGVEKVGKRREREKIETDEKEEIACVDYRTIGTVGDTETSQER